MKDRIPAVEQITRRARETFTGLDFDEAAKTARLTKKQQEVLRPLINNVPIVEISKQIGIKVDHVNSRIRCGIRRVRKALN